MKSRQSKCRPLKCAPLTRVARLALLNPFAQNTLAQPRDPPCAVVVPTLTSAPHSLVIHRVLWSAIPPPKGVPLTVFTTATPSRLGKCKCMQLGGQVVSLATRFHLSSSASSHPFSHSSLLCQHATPLPCNSLLRECPEELLGCEEGMCQPPCLLALVIQKHHSS